MIQIFRQLFQQELMGGGCTEWNKGNSVFQFKTSRFVLLAAWFFDSSREKMSPAPAGFPFPTHCHRRCAATSRSHEVCLPISVRWWLFFGCCQGCWKLQDQQGEPLARSTGNAVPAQDPTRSPGKFTVRWHRQFPSKLRWDFALEAACKLNKCCNIFARQLY